MVSDIDTILMFEINFSQTVLYDVIDNSKVRGTISKDWSNNENVVQANIRVDFHFVVQEVFHEHVRFENEKVRVN